MTSLMLEMVLGFPTGYGIPEPQPPSPHSGLRLAPPALSSTVSLSLTLGQLIHFMAMQNQAKRPRVRAWRPLTSFVPIVPSPCPFL